MKEPYEEGLASHLGPESCADTARDSVKRRQGLGGVGIQLRKDPSGRRRLKHAR